MKIKNLLICGFSLVLVITGSCPVKAETVDPSDTNETPVLQYDGNQEEPETVTEEPEITWQSARSAERLINLYGICSEDAELVTLPEGYPSSWQIPSDSYQVVSNPDDCISISASGIVTPKMETWYSNGSFWTTGYIEGAPTRTEVKTGTATLLVNTGGAAEMYTVNVSDYANDVYPDIVLNSLIERYIPENPTQYQVLEGATKMAASFDYSVSASNWKQMLLHNGGDCWASTSLIMKLCSDYGIEAKNRNANRDPGTGSGHRNVLARIGSEYYIADAGFTGNAPRHYVLEPSEPFSYSFSSSSNSYAIYQYDGFESEVEFPSLRGSYPVTELDMNLFSNDVTRVTLPSTIQLVRPMSLEGQMILLGAFSSGTDLVDISVDSANEVYCDIDGVLFTKDRKTLVQFPAGRTGTYSIPEGTETIGPGAFCKSKVDTVNIPASLKTISDFSFIDTTIEKIFFKGERPSFGNYCFYLSTLVVESENFWKDMDSFDFGPGEVTYVHSSLLKQISSASISGINAEYLHTGKAITPKPVVKNGSKTLAEGKDYSLSYSNNVNPGTATITITGIGSYTGTIQKTFVITEPAGKPSLIQISSASVFGINAQYTHTGQAISPKPVVKIGSRTLAEGKDYKLSYSSNVNPGTATITITGIGSYTGTIKKTFTIIKQNSQKPDLTPPAATAKPTKMHRLYNPNSGEHFYTAADNEKDHLVSVGWKYEGEGWKAPDRSNTPVYRLYNANAGDHHYTMNPAEKDMLVSVGWKYEGIGWYSDDSKSVPLYRQYNPNAKAGSHNYTTNKAENDHLVKVGWKAEGIGWYGMK